MDGRRREAPDGGVEVVVSGDARQRFYDSRGYGRPLDGGALALAPVEAAHLLFRGDLDAVDGDGFQAFLAAGDAGFAARFLVYKDLRDRGFYLSPARPRWVDEGDVGDADFVVYPRGNGPWDDAVEYRVRAVGERVAVPASDLGGVVLAVVDEESEITYFDTAAVDPAADVAGTGEDEAPPAATATLLDDRAVVWDPPDALHCSGFYGHPLGDDDAPLQLSLVEAAYLAAAGTLSVAGEGDGVDALRRTVKRGRSAEGERFDRRLRAYRDLRDRGLVPKTGFKFGADFRVYGPIDSVDDLGHAEFLVRVLPPRHDFSPRALALDVRLAHGVRKRMLFARQSASDTTAIDWLSVSRLTP